MLLPGGLDPGGWKGPDPGGGGWKGLDPGDWTQGAGPRWYTQCYFSNFLLALGSGPGGLDPGGWTGLDPGGLDPGGWTQVVHSMLLL